MADLLNRRGNPLDRFLAEPAHGRKMAGPSWPAQVCPPLSALKAASILPLSCILLSRASHKAASRRPAMMPATARRLLPLAALLAWPALYPAAAAPAGAAPAGTVILAPHRAVYELELKKSHGARTIEAVHGRILYDFSGSACEGYTLQFRQVSEFVGGEARAVLGDLRSTTWEDGDATKFRFNSQNRLDDEQTEAVDGFADRSQKSVTVTLKKPQQKTLAVTAGAVFPTEHMRRIVEAARAGKTILDFPVYDGSENGQKLYNTLTVIGKPIAPGAAPDDAAGKIPALAAMTRWPVTISYFVQQDEGKPRIGEQMPVYAITFEIYENGISRALTLDYSDFTLSGKLVSLDLKKASPCP